jgi:5-methyltetrahydrofolate--homocysteine methyltransferase
LTKDPNRRYSPRPITGLPNDLTDMTRDSEPSPALPTRRPTEAGLAEILRKRIAALDGPKGTMIQRLDLSEGDFRGDLLRHHPRDLRGNNDILCLTRPDVVRDIHLAHFAAGADIIQTNTFNATRVSQADYGTEELATEIAGAAARIAREAADRVAREQRRPTFVAGSLGPTNKTASLSPDVSRPEFRAITFDELVRAYGEQARALLDGGVDILLVETIFDTLNAKAALFAIEEEFDRRATRVPVMISVTVTDKSGRTLSGQTIGAFWHSVAHARPFSVGLNCALGAAEMRPYLEELSSVAGCYVSCYPNAGLPNAFGGYDEAPEHMAGLLGEYADAGWLNIVGGCCGSTPDHISAIAARMHGVAPRIVPPVPPALRLSGLEPLIIG